MRRIIANNINQNLLSLIQKYEKRLKQLKIDQKTDDSCSHEVYLTQVFVLEQVIEDIKELITK